MRTFLILARYAAQTVFDEQLELLKGTGHLLWPPANAAKLLIAWSQFVRVKLKLELYEWFLYARGRFGLENSMPGIAG